MRSYNLSGVKPKLHVSIEIHKPARTVTEKGWPEMVVVRDICSV